jgi:hypothetical protein
MSDLTLRNRSTDSNGLQSTAYDLKLRDMGGGIHAEVVSGAAYTSSVSWTRPENTTDYTAEDVVGIADAGTPANAGSAIHTFADAGPTGGEALVTGFDLYIYASAALAQGTSYRVELYDASPTAILDNAAFNLVAGDRSKHLCSISLATPVDKGDTLVSENNQINQQIKLASGSTSVYAELVDVGGSTPTSALGYKMRLRTMAL